ncbi:uncharacterized protein V6R79_022588 [Siganus canaliculatus]
MAGRRENMRERTRREEERDTTRDNFGTLVRNFSKFIRADYHLHRVNSPEPHRMPQFFKQYQKDLESAVLPALPNANTGLLTKYNGTNWVHTSLQILQEHYEKVKVQVKENIQRLEIREWERAMEVASRWVCRDVRGIRDEEIRRGRGQLIALVREMRGQVDKQDEEETSSRGSSLLEEDEDAFSVSSAGSSKRKALRQDPLDTREERGEGSRSGREKGGKAMRKRETAGVRETPTPERDSREEGGLMEWEAAADAPSSAPRPLPPRGSPRGGNRVLEITDEALLELIQEEEAGPSGAPKGGPPRRR